MVEQKRTNTDMVRSPPPSYGSVLKHKNPTSTDPPLTQPDLEWRILLWFRSDIQGSIGPSLVRRPQVQTANVGMTSSQRKASSVEAVVDSCSRKPLI